MRFFYKVVDNLLFTPYSSHPSAIIELLGICKPNLYFFTFFQILDCYNAGSDRF